MSSLLSNPLASAEQLSNRASNSQFPSDALDAVFVAVQCLTQAAGLLLDIPQSTTAQANVVLARYWVSEPPETLEFSVRVNLTRPRTAVHPPKQSLTCFPPQDISAAALFVTSKDGPHPRSPRDICNVYTYLLSPVSPLFHTQPSSTPNAPPPPNPETYIASESTYATFHTRLIQAESRILTTLGYDISVSLPHPLAITYLQALDFAGHPRDPGPITARVLAYLNTALLSPQMLYLTHQPGELATAAIFLASRDLGAKMPPEPWWELFDVDREQLGFLAVSLISVETIVRRQREEFPFLSRGMVTRNMLAEALSAATPS